MATWKFTTVASLATLMLAGPVFAQAAGSSATDTKSEQPRGRNSRTADEKVKAAQQALKDKGHAPGTVDGRMGPKTLAALRDFQKAEGIEATGLLDPQTLQALGVEVGRTGSTASAATEGSASPTTSGTTEKK